MGNGAQAIKQFCWQCISKPIFFYLKLSIHVFVNRIHAFTSKNYEDQCIFGIRVDIREADW